MLVDQALQDFSVAEGCHTRTIGDQQIGNKFAIRTAKPLLNRHAKSDFLARQNPWRQGVLHRRPQYGLAAAPTDQELVGKPRNKLGENSVHKWHSALNRTCHHHSIATLKEIVR